MKKITISSSLKFTEQIKSTMEILQKVNVVGLFPHLDNPIKKEDVTLELMKVLETEHFKAIDKSEGVYVICPEGYVGKLVSAEIGYATAQKKPVIFSEIPEDLGLQALATSYLPLVEVDKIKDL
jgi:hypothetical protein